jgi:catechol 2,3-dioxygenase-like lactoylglutathione lyase family enzyme
MEANELHRGRLIDHIQLVVSDFEKSKAFYKAIFAALDVPLGGEGDDYFYCDELFISSMQSLAASGALTGRAHIAFQAKDEATVNAVYKAAIAAGGKSNGEPGQRNYHPGYYAAFVLDPDGNNIECVFHGAAKRSAPSVKITF